MMITVMGWYMIISCSWVVSLCFGNYIVRPEDRANALQMTIMCVAAFIVWPLLLALMTFEALRGFLGKRKGL